MAHPPKFRSETCPDCKVPHTLRWIDPPKAWMGECPKLPPMKESGNVDHSFLAKKNPGGPIIFMAQGMTVANFTVQGDVVGYHHGS
jgi:hypothetical protein